MATSRSIRCLAAAVVFAAGSMGVTSAAELALAPRSIVNQSGTSVESGGARWLGTGAHAAASLLGMVFAVPDLPRTAFRSATLLLTAAWTQWIPVDVQIAAELSPNPADFGPRALPTGRTVTTPVAHYAENTRWGGNGVYAIDVTEPVRALLARYGQPAAIALIAAGRGTPWGRKYFATNGAAPSLKLTFEDPPAPPPAPAPTQTAPTLTSSQTALNGA